MPASIEPVPGRDRRPGGRRRPWPPQPTAVADARSVGPECDIGVARPVMYNDWTQLTFLHWSFDPDVVQAILPPGLTVDTFEGRAWVGLVPFLMEVRPPAGPRIPWLSRFCETNVRTYATAADGTRGVWFLSLEAARLPAVVTARTAYGLPYFWASMEFERRGDTVTYRSRRRWPGPRAASSRVQVQVGDPFEPHELGPLDHFLTARWRLYIHRDSHRPGPAAALDAISRATRRPIARPAPRPALRYALAEHEPWPLQRVKVLDIDDQLVAAGGLPTPTGEPVAHWSEGTRVRLSLPRLLPQA